jgi:hypothetical protein
VTAYADTVAIVWEIGTEHKNKLKQMGSEARLGAIATYSSVHRHKNLWKSLEIFGAENIVMLYLIISVATWKSPVLSFCKKSHRL